MSDTILHEHPLSPYCQKNKIALREKNVAFTCVQLDLGGAAAPLAKLNPRGEVPVLCRGSDVVFDSSVIQEYIEDCWPSPSLLPAAPAARARARMIEDIMDTQYEAVTWGLMEVRLFRRAAGPAADALTARAATQLRGLHAWLTRELGGDAWFGGKTFGWADIAVVPFVAAAAAQNLGPPPRGPLARWLANALGRPSVAETVAEAAAALETVTRAAPRALSARGFRREYRDHRLEWMIRSGGLGVVHHGLAGDTIRFSHELC